jgi:hypothetical protein
MTEERAAEMMVTETPRLSLACLRELRFELDAGQSFVRDDSARECHVRNQAVVIPTCLRLENRPCR